MNEGTDQPVIVTGEERRHPAIRQLARACIELARQRLAKEEVIDRPEPEPQPAPKPPAATGGEEVRHG
jgi:hypothetical protein